MNLTKALGYLMLLVAGIIVNIQSDGSFKDIINRGFPVLLAEIGALIVMAS